MAKAEHSVIRAAGAVVWRESDNSLEVLLVHRPKYDDWSFPKGKLEAGESTRSCAVREVAEETGQHIALGQPLSTARYRVKGNRKEVSYWVGKLLDADSPAVTARAAVTPASPREIDAVEWVSASQARRRLTHAHDRDLLGEVLDLYEDGKLDTWPFILVRHARAVKRSVWNRPKERSPEEDEATRPLTKDQGVVRAKALVPILSAYGVDTVTSSPWLRCMDTLAPYAAAAQLTLQAAPALTEYAAREKPERAGTVVDSVIREPQASALCTHRPVLPVVMDVVSNYAPGKLLRSVPHTDPWLKTGEIMVMHMAVRPRGKVRAVAIEKQRPVLNQGRAR